MQSFMLQLAVIFLVLGGLLAVFGWRLRRRLARMKASRRSFTKDDFSNYFLARGASQPLIDDVWAALVHALAVDGFKPHPEDRLNKDYGLGEEDLDEDIMLALLERHGCRVPAPDELKRMGPIETVADLVDFLVKMHPLSSPGQAR